MVYVAELDGRPIIVMSAESTADARIFLGPIADDVWAVHYNGAPVWDGIETLSLREASLAERAVLEASRTRAILRKFINEDDWDWYDFLIPVVYPDTD